MNKLKVLDLFSGIGGFSLGLERTGGFETVAFCEIEPFPRKVLAKHWRETPIYEDVRTLTAEQLAADGITVDVITGGFPCQDISVAGKQAGIGEGTRSGLWSECIRLISELRPSYAIFENVSNLLSGPAHRRGGWFSRILADLASIGYDAEWENIPASALGASHRRERVWVVAYPNSSGLEQSNQEVAHQSSEQSYGSSIHAKVLADSSGSELQGCSEKEILGFARLQRQSGRSGENELRGWATEPSVGRVVNGIPNRPHRIKGLGNAVVPQIPELIGRAIMEINNG